MQNFPSTTIKEPRLVPHWARAEGLTEGFVFFGTSMGPLFRTGDLLYVRPLALEDVHPGAVVVFRGSLEAEFVVHRVVGVTSTGLVTRGDANTENDPVPLTPQNLIGQVELIERGGRIRRVPGPELGIFIARVGPYCESIVRLIGYWLGFPYRFLRDSKIARRLLARVFDPRFERICLQTPYGILIKVTCRGKIVARWMWGQKRFKIRKPYDLFLRPDDLFSAKRSPPTDRIVVKLAAVMNREDVSTAK